MKKVLLITGVIAFAFLVLSIDIENTSNTSEEKESKNLATEEMNSVKKENILPKPEFKTFENYIAKSTVTFNGEGSLQKQSNTTDKAFRDLIINSSELYLKHFKASGEIQKEAESIVDDTIEIAKEGNNPKSDSKHAQYFKKLKKNFNQINKIINNK